MLLQNSVWSLKEVHAVQFSCVFPVFVAVSGFGVDCINPLSGNADLEVADESLN